MAEIRMPSSLFVEKLKAAYERHDGYIMGSKGQNPKKWSKSSWWFAQYTNSKQHDKALYWRENAARVWDCNGMAEGIYEDYTGIDINTKARYNYANWCLEKRGIGMIPMEYRVPGAAVFWSDTTAAKIHHVGYLIEPIKENDPSGDWWIIEARGVMYGVVRTKLSERKPNFWGWMTKYFDYDDVASGKDLPLHKGMKGNDVKSMQESLIRLGYSCGKYGADGDFGSATEAALIKFQENNGLEADGIYGEKTKDAVEKLLKMFDGTTEDIDNKDVYGYITITGGSVWLWSAPPALGGKKVKVVHKGDTFETPPWQYSAMSVDGTVLWANIDYLKISKEKT